jgi:hypothetical protein
MPITPKNLDQILKTIQIRRNQIQSKISTIQNHLHSCFQSYEWKTLFIDNQVIPSSNKAYTELKKLKQKLVKIENILDKGLPVQQKVFRPKLILKTPIRNSEGFVSYKQNIYCGRNSKANQKVYNITKNKDYWYYHANLRGGGLIALKQRRDGFGNALALLYSQCIKQNFRERESVASNNVRKATSKQGSFYFNDATYVSVEDPLILDFYIENNNLCFNWAFYKKPKGVFFQIVPKESDRFKEFMDAFKDYNLVNIDLLETVIPKDYTLKRIK